MPVSSVARCACGDRGGRQSAVSKGIGVRSGVSQQTAAASGGSVLFTVVHEGSGAWCDADGASGLMC